jgi:phytoene dehydrogenase-like protein
MPPRPERRGWRLQATGRGLAEFCPVSDFPGRAQVIGSGPNGLSAAIALAQAGLPVDVYEAQPKAGGAARTLPLTLPGFLHDFGSAVHPLAAGSPFFRTLPLAQHGLRWLHHPTPLAHPLDDGTAVTLERDLDDAVGELGIDGRAWRRLMQPLVEQWPAFAAEILGPALHLPRSPLLLARFGIFALAPARLLANTLFRSPRTRALFAGLAAHSFLSLSSPLSAAVGIVLGAATHAVGWPIPEGGAQAITDALVGVLRAHGGVLHTGARIQSLHSLDPGSLGEFASSSVTLCDVAPAQLLTLAGNRLPPGYRRTLARFQPGPAAFKLDYALSEPIPWRAAACRRASTVHLGGTLEEVERSEAELTRGIVSERPFVLLAQPTLADPTRAPAGRHVAWAYCHLPHGSTVDAAALIEAQIERFAPGFRECVLARTVSTPQTLEALDANLQGGDISGGAMTLGQTLLRPSWRAYATPDKRLFLCSASTPPGAGVHGMCGFHAAHAALRSLRQ